MRATVVTFSPSGSTLALAKRLKERLEAKGERVQLLDITGESEIFSAGDMAGFLKRRVEEHDVLLIGGPIYAHHLHYTMLDLIKTLPAPGGVWGKRAFPFVTYGGLASGTGLEEAGKALKRSGRIVPAGLKLSAPHAMSGAFLDEVYNKNSSIEQWETVIDEFISRVDERESNSLGYSSLAGKLKAKLLVNEKHCHKTLYPSIKIKEGACNGCGKCIRLCPVLHLKAGEDRAIYKDSNSPCIHCFNCVRLCPKKAAFLDVELEKARSFFENIASKGKENPQSAVYPLRR